MIFSLIHTIVDYIIINSWSFKKNKKLIKVDYSKRIFRGLHNTKFKQIRAKWPAHPNAYAKVKKWIFDNQIP